MLLIIIVEMIVLYIVVDDVFIVEFRAVVSFVFRLRWWSRWRIPRSCCSRIHSNVLYLHEYNIEFSLIYFRAIYKYNQIRKNRIASTAGRNLQHESSNDIVTTVFSTAMAIIVSWYHSVPTWKILALDFFTWSIFLFFSLSKFFVFSVIHQIAKQKRRVYEEHVSECEKYFKLRCMWSFSKWKADENLKEFILRKKGLYGVS